MQVPELTASDIVSVLIFWLIVWHRWSRQADRRLPTVSEPNRSPLKNTPLVSIIVPARNEADQIAVPNFILAKQNQMVAAVGAPASGATSFPGYVDLATDDGFDPGSEGRVVELNGSEQIPMIGESQSRHL